MNSLPSTGSTHDSGEAVSNPPAVRHGAIPGRDVPRYGAVTLLWAVLDHLQRQGVEIRLTPYQMMRGPLKASRRLLYELGAIPDETAGLDAKVAGTEQSP